VDSLPLPEHLPVSTILSNQKAKSSAGLDLINDNASRPPPALALTMTHGPPATGFAAEKQDHTSSEPVHSVATWGDQPTAESEEKKGVVAEPGAASDRGHQHSFEEEDDEDDEDDSVGEPLEPTPSRARDVWKFHLRPPDDDEPQ
jgi:hypothetical protein